MGKILDSFESIYKKNSGLERKVRMILFNGKVIEKTLPFDKANDLENSYTYNKRRNAYDLRKPKEGTRK